MSIYSVIDRLEAARQYHLAAEGPPMDPPANRLDVLRRARAYVDKTPPAIEGQGGDEHTFKVCCKLVRGFTLDDDEALDVLAPWNATCAPPWTERELRAKITSARRNGREPHGGKLADRPGWTGAPGEDVPPPGDDEAPPVEDAPPPDVEAPPFAERFPDFCTRVNSHTLPPDIVPNLIPGMGITMIHGQPRDMKTLCRQEITRAASTGDAAFGLEVFRVAAPIVTWVITEEDPAIVEKDRYCAFFAGRGQAHPDALHVSIQKAIDLDDPQWQALVIAYVKRHAVQLVVIDPVRASTAMADQGPRELKPFAKFLRRLMRETGCAVLLVHHDVKPLVGKADDRAKPQRASGGGIFSIADSPIHAERLTAGGLQTMLTPSLYKYSASPEPFVVTLEADDPKRPTMLRLHGEVTTAGDAAELALHTKILEYLREHPGATGSGISKALQLRKGTVFEALDTLELRDCVTHIKSGQAKLWSALTIEAPDVS
ncbi:MAG: AAA family ATPase [Acidobacteria bacterium]|nr:AAA family ATPase [Acidobacteriota bacterium]